MTRGPSGPNGVAEGLIEESRARPLFESGGPYHDAANELSEEWSEHPADRSLRLEYPEIDTVAPDFADQLISNPAAARTAIRKYLKSNVDPDLIATDVRVRGLPDSLTLRVGDLRTRHLRTLVAVQAEVVKVESVEPWAKVAAFVCPYCHKRIQVKQNKGFIRYPDTCERCEEESEVDPDVNSPSIKKDDWKLDDAESTIRDFQTVVVTPLESTLEDPPAIMAYLIGDVVDSVGKGDEVTVVGTYQTQPLPMQKETQLNVYLDAWDIDVDTYSSTDVMRQSDLDELLHEAYTKLEESEDGSFGADAEAVIDHVADEHDMRRREVADRLAEIEAEREGQVFTTAGRLMWHE
jgi:DNA replicative helicase MCM subunit Mcm2 (Cdc46/Mcm family)